MFSLRPSERREDERCALCHDGPTGLVICRGCGALTHAQCLLHHGSCPTPGCDERDPMQEPPPSVRGQLKEWRNFFRGEKGPREEPRCRHKFGKDQRCVYCHRDVDDIWQDGPPVYEDPDARGPCKKCGKEVFAGLNCLAEQDQYGEDAAYYHMSCWRKLKDQEREKRRPRWWASAELWVAALFVMFLIAGIGELIVTGEPTLMLTAILALVLWLMDQKRRRR